MRLRLALAAAGILLGPGLATCGAPSSARADGVDRLGVIAPARFRWDWSDPHSAVAPPRPFAGFRLEAGARYWYSTGNHQLNLGGLFAVNPLVSRLTWNDLEVHSGETFLRIDHSSGLFFKGVIGAGSVVDGNLRDEDFPPGVVPYSSTNSEQRDGDMRYFNIDVGYTVWQMAETRFGVFAGYGVWDEQVRAFGCQQTAGHGGICVPSIPATSLGITHTYEWDFWRVGLVGDARLAHGFGLSVEAAWLARADLSGSDTHHWRPSALLGGFDGATPFDAKSGGVQLEAVLKYAVSSRFDVGVGGRYWHIAEDEGQTHFEVSVPGALPQFSSSSSERMGVFVQGSFRLN
jgi:hypothetical protein